MKKSGKSLTMLSLSLLFGAILFWGCDDDNEKSWDVSSDPALELQAAEIHSEQGRTIRIEGIATDEVGIKKINLNIDDWYLNRDIEISTNDSVVKSYELSYDFLVPEDAANKGHSIQVTVYNMGDRTASEIVEVFMDGDFTNPVLDVKNPVNGLTLAPDSELPVEINAVLGDSRQLGYFVARESSINFYDSVSFMGTGQLNFEYQNIATLPAEVGEYNFEFVLADSAGNVVTSNRVVKASFDFDKLYLADVATDEELNSDLFGVPMLISKTAPYNFEGKYYAEAPGAEVRFVPQTTSFAPHCYGLDPNDPSKLINDPENALPIVLDQKGYYLISVDLENMTYNVESYVPDDWYFEPKIENPDDDAYIETEYVGKLGLVGKGFPDYPDQDWATWASIELERDPENNYRFYKTLDMEGTVEFIFQPEHPWGWWPEPFWRFDRKVDPEKTILKGGENVAMTVAVRTTYKVTFDSHLNRAKVVPVQ
ncbi:Ig-like domain repeat protein [Marinilabilia salmonicolor]|jgi:hypothetical protein|uniref:Ig-like domain-containing protein n=1 Tax=Marinilabilia salmonicolor TaxID=989 RepID=A0A2T0XIN8_9BACT|nr:Ig-like domain repeat protein [Marinilabilia salmonicolor]PRY98834.1 hypothetical protein BY457_109102 [Marinilabilia salmonicolor]RCW38893.1 hypothetical protein DFO77_10247 [Marinilabilia salmonicolor]